jgi:hypothetical protein
MDELQCLLTFESYNYNVDEVRMVWYDTEPVALLNNLKREWMNSSDSTHMAPPELISIISNLPAVQLADYELIKLVSSATAAVSYFIVAV